MPISEIVSKNVNFIWSGININVYDPIEVIIEMTPINMLIISNILI